MIRPGPILAVLMIGVLWGVNWPVVKVILTDIPPFTLRGVAFPLAALGLAIGAKGAGYRLYVPRHERVALCGAGLFLVFGFNVLATFGQVLVETSKAAIIAYTMPALTALLAVIFLRERIGARLIAALMMGMAGLGLLASEDMAALRAEPLGPMITLAAALSWAIGNVALKARDWETPPLVLSVWFFVLSAVLVWPFVIVFEPPWTQTWPEGRSIALMAYHILGPMIVCYFVWTVVIARLPATVAAISVLTAPVMGVVSAVWFLGDPLTWQKVTSLAMIVLSIGLTLSPMKTR